jgi:cytidylate kinase
MLRHRSIGELVEEQVRRSELGRWRNETGDRLRPGPVVTISRSLGSGARLIARRLADELGYSLWDRELLDAMAHQAQVSLPVVESYDEKPSSFLGGLVHVALDDHAFTDFSYPEALARVTAEVAQHGYAIILGRGAGFLLPEALTVRIDASPAHRIRNLVRHEGLSPEAATARIARSDRERRDFLRTVFGHDRVAQASYDLSLWMDRTSIEDAVAILRTAIDVRFRPVVTKAGAHEPLPERPRARG